MDKGASPSATGLSQAEPEVSALRASIPSVDDIEPPTTADVYRRTPSAISVVAGVVGCDHERALEILRGIVEGGYFVAPRIPTDPMLYGYFTAYGQQAWSPRTVIQNIGKARLRWQAMGQSGTAMALSRKFLRAAPQGIETGTAKTEGLGPKDESPGPEGNAPDSIRIANHRGDA